MTNQHTKNLFKKIARQASLLITGCVALTVASSAHAVSENCGTGGVYLSNHSLFAWKSGNFSGSGCRKWEGDVSYLSAVVNMTAGGYDAGVGRAGVSSKKVDSIAIGQAVEGKFNYSVSGNGHWWAGPKTIISSTSNYTGLDGQYECYIIERAEKGPNDLVSYFGGTYKGQGTYDGSVYKHYTTKYGKINQIWSVRQSYRNGGYTSVGYIMKDWRKLGIVPNWYCLGWKYNVEYNSANNGYLSMNYLKLPYN
jgi:hypothetical protein